MEMAPFISYLPEAKPKFYGSPTTISISGDFPKRLSFLLNGMHGAPDFYYTGLDIGKNSCNFGY